LPAIEDIGHELAEALKVYDADHIEAHLERSDSSHITYRGQALESIGRTTAIGGNIRVLSRGGWGFTSFNDINDLPSRIELALKQAKYAGNEKSKLAPVASMVEKVAAEADNNPVVIPLAEKKQLLDEYNALIWQTPKLKTSVIGYGDSYKKTIFASSSGSYIEQERADIGLRLTAVATSSNEVQQANLSLGSSGNFSQIKGLHQQIQEMAQHSVELLSAPLVKGGEYTVVLDPTLAGVFVHEAFGHLSESDFVYENPMLHEIMTLGKEFGNAELNIIDSAILPDLRGSYKYDDEGVPASKTYLIREGKLVGRLHSRETAGKMNEKPTGNARTVNYRYPPIVRMTNTYIEPNSVSLDDMLADIKEGVYVKGWYGGTTSMEMFTFSSGEAYMIRDGKIAEMLRPVVLSGNVFTTLKNIDAIGNDIEMNQGGGCGKGEQAPLPVSNGSPHIRIRKCLVGGK
jgi:TldD protein|tara:strand:- start:1174 stop:2550 length:1377 start_codon:yes stop_codon:yes gene_type:complete